MESLLLDFLELGKQMTLSNARSEEAKNRDYKLHEDNMFQLFRRIGLLFQTKSDPYHVAKEAFKSDQKGEGDIDVFGKALACFPAVTKDTVGIMVKILSGQGVYTENNDILVILRHFHSLKYK